MNFFSFDYTKPGLGISKDAPKKKGVFLYFELLFRKIFKLIQVSWLYCLTSIPYVLVILFIVTTYFTGHIQQALSVGVNSNILNQENMEVTSFIVIILITVLFLVLWGSGPASAGFAYVTRCFTREEHSWILTDFIGKMKENFKQSMLVVIIDFFVLMFLPYAIIQYWNLYVAKNQIAWLILFYVCIYAFAIYTFMHHIIYQIMVTYNCKFGHLLKYSLLIAFGKLPMNLLLTAIPVVTLFVLFNYLQPIPAVIFVLGLLFGFLRFPIEFYAARTIPRILNALTEDE